MQSLRTALSGSSTAGSWKKVPRRQNIRAAGRFGLCRAAIVRKRSKFSGTWALREGECMSVRLSGTGLALLALCAGNCLFANVIGNPRADFRQSYSLHANGRVTIQNLYGDVRITAWDRDEVLVEAIKKSDDPRQLRDARI